MPKPDPFPCGGEGQKPCPPEPANAPTGDEGKRADRFPRRYRLVPPVEGGEAYWLIADKDNEANPNFAVASFFKDMPNAQDEAVALCARLNGY